MKETRVLNAAWWLLLGATAVTYVLGEMGLVAAGSGWALACLWALTSIKGVVVIQVFLEMRHAPLLWRWLLQGWLGLVLALIAVAYAVGGRLGG